MLSAMEKHEFDVVVIGAGMAGATAAAALSADRKVALVEAEEAPGACSAAGAVTCTLKTCSLVTAENCARAAAGRRRRAGA